MLSNLNQQPVAPARGGTPVAPPVGGARANAPFKNLGMPGLLLMIAGLVLCGSFFFPWFSSSLACNDPVCHPPTMKDTHFLSHYAASPTGFSIARGTFALDTTGLFGPIHEGFSFLLLWLVFLAGLLLIGLPLLLALGKMDAGRTRIFLVVLCLVALAIEVGYGLSVAQALPQTRAGLASLLNNLAVPSGHAAVFAFSTSAAVGFWLALGATLVGTAASSSVFYTGRRLDTALFWRNLGLSGQVALVAGLVLCITFFLPWFSTPDPLSSPAGGYLVSSTKKTVTVAQTITLSGWNTAAGGLRTPFFVSGSCATCLTPQVNIFLFLWLIPLAGLVLAWIAWLLGEGRLWRRMAAIMAVTTALVALVLEVFFLLEVQSLQSYSEQVFQLAGQRLTSTAYSVVWGFWAALAVTGVALLVSGFLLLQRHKSVTGAPARP